MSNRIKIYYFVRSIKGNVHNLDGSLGVGLTCSHNRGADGLKTQVNCNRPVKATHPKLPCHLCSSVITKSLKISSKRAWTWSSSNSEEALEFLNLQRNLWKLQLIEVNLSGAWLRIDMLIKSNRQSVSWNLGEYSHDVEMSWQGLNTNGCGIPEQMRSFIYIAAHRHSIASHPSEPRLLVYIELI